MKLKLIELLEVSSQKRLADGCILPDGQVAVAWLGEYHTHGCYPSMAALESIVSKTPDRVVQAYDATYEEIRFGLENYSFQLVREIDFTNISGTGVVAVGCDFFNRGCVLQWTGDIKSTFWYPGIEAVKALHGHQGRTKVVVNKEVL